MYSAIWKCRLNRAQISLYARRCTAFVTIPALASTISLSSARCSGEIGASLSLTGWATGTLSPYCSITSSTQRRNALATGVRANMARRWQPRREKIRTRTVKLTVSRFSTTCVMFSVNSSAFLSYRRLRVSSLAYPKARAISDDLNHGWLSRVTGEKVKSLKQREAVIGTSC